MERVCAFFGHREVWEDITKPLEDAVRFAIGQGFTVFWFGQQGMFDSLAICVVRQLKKEFPFIRLVLIIAYLTCDSGKVKLYDETL